MFYSIFEQQLVYKRSFAFVCTDEGEVVAACTLDCKEPDYWLENLHTYWEEVVVKLSDTSVNKAKLFEYAVHPYRTTFDLGYVCSAGGEHRDHQKIKAAIKGTVRYLLYGLAQIINNYWVVPISKIIWIDPLRYERANNRYASLSDCINDIRRLCFFSLYAVGEGVKKWPKLGFELTHLPHSTFESMYRSVFDEEGNVPTVQMPTLQPPDT